MRPRLSGVSVIPALARLPLLSETDDDVPTRLRCTRKQSWRNEYLMSRLPRDPGSSAALARQASIATTRLPANSGNNIAVLLFKTKISYRPDV